MADSVDLSRSCALQRAQTMLSGDVMKTQSDQNLDPSGARVSIARPGGREVLTLSGFTPASPGPGEVMIRVSAIGVNFADIAVRLGLYESAKRLVGWPITPGFDIAGVIEEVGPPGEGGDSRGEHTTRWKRGDEVFGVTFFGAYSTHVTLPADQIFTRPSGWSWARAAAFPTVHLTAWYALYQLGAPHRGQRVLIHSAAGGVGLALTQLCVATGLEVVGVVRGAHKVDVVRSAGAHHVIDKGAEPIWTGVDREAQDGFDLIFDANGYETLRGGYRRLRPEGRLVCYGAATMLKRGGGRRPWLRLAWRYLTRPQFDPLAMTSDNRSVMAFNLSFLFHRKVLLREAFHQLLSLDAPLMEQPCTLFALSEVAQAHQLLESGTSVGKIILTP